MKRKATLKIKKVNLYVNPEYSVVNLDKYVKKPLEKEGLIVKVIPDDSCKSFYLECGSGEPRIFSGSDGIKGFFHQVDHRKIVIQRDDERNETKEDSLVSLEEV